MSSMWMVDGYQLSATATQPFGCILAQNKQGADDVQRYKRLVGVFIEFLNISTNRPPENDQSRLLHEQGTSSHSFHLTQHFLNSL
ncbi:Guanyl-specific ribonuclease F1 [Fusarium oxysporum f. sp. albedinis]|nr:Guanyl-specific ribonuclease F1 [Fusarium oxysporum f. sp. albedinis]